MTAFAKMIDEIWRDFETDGVPASGAHKISKADMRAWGGVVESLLDGLPTDIADVITEDEMNAAVPGLIQAYNQANASTVRTDTRILLMVKSATTFATPVSPSSGDMYIVPTGATGAWSTHVGTVALYTAGAWTYWTPADGWSAFAKDAGLIYVYNGTSLAWVQAASSIVSVTASLVQVSALGKTTSAGGGKVKTWLTANNDVFAAGDNTNSQNGYSVGATDLPVKVQFNVTPGTITKIVQSATSTYILDNTGKVWSLGGNSSGQLGHGDTTSRQVATRIEYFVANSLAIADIFASGDAAGTADYVFFVTTGGAAYACGNNGNGQLGLGDTTQRTTPTLVTAVSSVARVTCAGNTSPHTLLITTAGALWTTGYNGAGQLGQGDTTQRTTFTVVSGFTNASKAAASGSSTASVGNSYVLKTDGTVWACGYNAYGQLGQGDTSTRNAFTQISSLSSITDIQAGPDYTSTVAALKSDGNMYVWGYNGSGACGTANTTNQTSPQAPSFSGQGTISQIAVCGQATAGQAVYARTSSGTMWAAGISTNGNLGVNSTSSTVTSFTQCVGLDGTVTDFCITGAGSNFGPAVLYSDGRIATAGDNSKGQLGLGTGTSNSAIFHQVTAITPRGVKGDTGSTGATGSAGATGSNGSNGTDPGIRWAYSSTTTMADPSAGNLRFNNATLASVTAIAISYSSGEAGNPSVANFVKAFDDSTNTAHRGYLICKKASAPQNYVIFDITGALTDNTTWAQLAVTVMDSAGSLSNTDVLSVQFHRTGDANSPAGSTGQFQYNNAGALAAGNLWQATNIVEQRNSTNPQLSYIYKTYTDASNYERLEIGATASLFQVNVANAGTGSSRSLALAGNSIRFFTGNNGALEPWNITNQGHVLAVTDNTYDFGASGANRARTGYFGTSVVTPRVTITGTAGPGGLSNNGGVLSVDNGSASMYLGAGGPILINSNVQTFIGSPTSAIFQHGAADAASPVAQTLGVQNVVAGTTNIAGANFTIRGSAGTGTGAGGSIIFQVAPAGSSGSAQNSFATALSIDSTLDLTSSVTYAANKHLFAMRNLSSTGASAFQAQSDTIGTTNCEFGFWNSGRTPYGALAAGTGYIYANSTAGFVVMSDNGPLIFTAGGSTEVARFKSSTLGLNFATTAPISWGAAGSGDAFLYRDAANTVAQRNSTNAQIFHVYATYTDASNYERVAIGYGASTSGGATRFGIATKAAGTGTMRDLVLENGTSLNGGVVTLTSSGITLGTTNLDGWKVSSSGHFLAAFDNTYDIGASGANRARSIYAGSGIYGNVLAIHNGASTNRVFFSSTGSGILKLGDQNDSAFDRLQFGGTTSSFPALKRSSTALQTKLADDTDFAQMAAAFFNAAKAYTVATLPTAAAGMIARVSDASAPAVGSTVSGGGAAHALVWYNNANWTVIGV